MNQMRWGRLLTQFLILVLFAGLLVALTPESALAGPGGVVKAATRSTAGKIILGIIVVVLASVVTYFFVRRAVQIRRTRRDLKRLAALHPDLYNWMDIRGRVSDAFTFVWSAWSRQKMEAAGEFTTHWYRQNQQMLLDEWEEKGLENVCHLVSISSITPLYVEHRDGGGGEPGEGSRLVVNIIARVVDYVRRRESGAVVQGDTTEGDINTVWTLVCEDGAWRLNRIEDGAMEWDYLMTPNVLPAPLPGPSPQRS